MRKFTPSLRIMTTSECKNNCSYCFVKSAKGYKVQKGDWEKIKKSILEIDYYTLEIIGGEPFHDVDMLRNIFEFNMEKKRAIGFFSSGVYNTDEVFDLCMEYKDEFDISFNFSYDGRWSDRNKDDWEHVESVIKKFRLEFDTSVRWSITTADIPNTYKSFLNLTPHNSIVFFSYSL